MTRLYLTTITHTRTSPVRHRFRHRSCSWLVNLRTIDDRGRAADLPAPLRNLVTFRAGDHLGDPGRSWFDNVSAFAAAHDIDLRGGSVTALTNGRTLGHVFNPITPYWCHDAHGRLACVIAEVHNTYAQRHAYLLRPDEQGRGAVAKAFYVSPFNDVSGYYRMSMPEPGERVDLTVVLRRHGQRPFVASWQGRRAHRPVDLVRAAVRLPLATWLVSAQIRWHGIRLWRKLPVQPRPEHHRQEQV